jgi:hypothetical protein
MASIAIVGMQKIPSAALNNPNQLRICTCCPACISGVPDVRQFVFVQTTILLQNKRFQEPILEFFEQFTNIDIVNPDA